MLLYLIDPPREPPRGLGRKFVIAEPAAFTGSRSSRAADTEHHGVPKRLLAARLARGDCRRRGPANQPVTAAGPPRPASHRPPSVRAERARLRSHPRVDQPSINSQQQVGTHQLIMNGGHRPSGDDHQGVGPVRSRQRPRRARPGRRLHRSLRHGTDLTPAAPRRKTSPRGKAGARWRRRRAARTASLSGRAQSAFISSSFPHCVRRELRAQALRAPRETEGLDRGQACDQSFWLTCGSDRSSV